MYRDEFPGDWENDFREAIDTICPDCHWSMPEDWLNEHVYPLNATPKEALGSTMSWGQRLLRHDGRARKARW